jgi:hypothetical protein
MEDMNRCEEKQITDWIHNLQKRSQLRWWGRKDCSRHQWHSLFIRKEWIPHLKKKRECNSLFMIQNPFSGLEDALYSSWWVDTHCWRPHVSLFETWFLFLNKNERNNIINDSRVESKERTHHHRRHIISLSRRELNCLVSLSLFSIRLLCERLSFSQW